MGVEPGFEGSKVKKLREILAEDLKIKNRIIIWVNSYIDGVIRPEMEESGKVITEDIISKLKLPKDIVWTIHGEDKNRKKYREELQKRFNSGGAGKMVLFVSGNTVDVGVDFSGAEEIIHYNEPWSKYDKKQQDKRAHRVGLKRPLIAKTLITRGTIEEGIRRYIDAKEKAIEKLLRGLERTEAENKMLKKDANSWKKDIEADINLAEDYNNESKKLMLHFGAGWEAGEEYFKNMPEEEKESYASLYRKNRRLSYQGNNARVSISLLEKMIAEQRKNNVRLRILDIASGPEMLKRCAREDLRNQIYSMDINEKHFEDVVDTKRIFRKSYLNLPVRSGSADYYNIGFAFHQTKPFRFYKKNYEKLQVLSEMNRVLKVGGRAIISEIHNVEFINLKKFEELIVRLGMKVVKEYSGEVNGGENYRAHFLILEKVREIEEYGSDTFRLSDEEKKNRIKKLSDKLGKELLSGLEIGKLPKGVSHLNDQRRMINNFELNGKNIQVVFIEEDRKLFVEEKKSIQDGEALKKKFGGRIDDIPLFEIHKIGFKRKLKNPNLMYRIIENGGVIVIRGDKKKRNYSKRNE